LIDAETAKKVGNRHTAFQGRRLCGEGEVVRFLDEPAERRAKPVILALITSE